jgi:hypothetical protein
MEFKELKLTKKKVMNTLRLAVVAVVATAITAGVVAQTKLRPDSLPETPEKLIEKLPPPVDPPNPPAPPKEIQPPTEAEAAIPKAPQPSEPPLPHCRQHLQNLSQKMSCKKNPRQLRGLII